ncbi:MAG: DUF5060 domain-containing protein [Bacteroidota bacterium]
MKNLSLYISLYLCFSIFSACNPQVQLQEVEQWDLFSLDLAMEDDLSETDEENPFTNYRLWATFSSGEKTYVIPGYFAADGNAAESSASSGKIWRVKFRPNDLGVWTYKISFRKGKGIAISDAPDAGEVVAFDGKEGSFKVIPSTATEGFKADGRLQYDGKRYLKHEGSGKYFLKGGPDSPENFLAYRDFDATFSNWKDKENDPDAGEAYVNADNKDFTKGWEAHKADWQSGDPSWQGGKGKGIIGAINYIASKGMNVIYMLTMNIEGDGRDVWPYTAPDEFERFDCSKLDQWEIVFQHAQDKGILLHFITQETENEKLLDGGNTGPLRKLYYRELIARFGHHLAITWNLGEENGYAKWTPNAQDDAQRKAMARYINSHDPMNNLLVIHTHASPHDRDPILDSLLSFKDLDGISLQQGNPTKVHEVAKDIFKRAAAAGHPWLINMDELGPHYKGALPDAKDPGHDTIRQDVLWGAYMAGAAGVEWYFGYQHPNNDLNCEDWRSRDILWDQTRHAMDFFNNHLPYAEMENMDEITSAENDFVLGKAGEIYAIYQPANGKTEIDLSGQAGSYSVDWYDPRNGGGLQKGSLSEISGASLANIGNPPAMSEKDWVILLRKN